MNERQGILLSWKLECYLISNLHKFVKNYSHCINTLMKTNVATLFQSESTFQWWYILYSIFDKNLNWHSPWIEQNFNISQNRNLWTDIGHVYMWNIVENVNLTMFLSSILPNFCRINCQGKIVPVRHTDISRR